MVLALLATAVVVTPDPRPTGCVALVRRVARGEVLTAAATRPAACSGPRSAPIAFDRARRRVVATADLAADADLGRVWLPQDPAVERGATLRLVSRAGPVRIERAVTALQTSVRGRRVFVRDGDGQVFSARFDPAGAGR